MANSVFRRNLVIIAALLAIGILSAQSALAEQGHGYNRHGNRPEVIVLQAPRGACGSKVLLQPDLSRMQRRPNKVVVRVVYQGCGSAQRVRVAPIYPHWWRSLPTLVVEHVQEKGHGRSCYKRVNPCGNPCNSQMGRRHEPSRMAAPARPSRQQPWVAVLGQVWMR